LRDASPDAARVIAAVSGEAVHQRTRGAKAADRRFAQE